MDLEHCREAVDEVDLLGFGVLHAVLRVVTESQDFLIEELLAFIKKTGSLGTCAHHWPRELRQCVE